MSPKPDPSAGVNAPPSPPITRPTASPTQHVQDAQSALAARLSAVAGAEVSPDTMATIQQELGGVRGLTHQPARRLARRLALPEAAVRAVQAALELAREVALLPDGRPRLASADQVYERFASLSLGPDEVLAVACLDATNHLEDVIPFVGGGPAVVVDAVEVLRRCLARGARRVVLVHPHPGGNAEPSAADLRVTRRLVRAAHVVGISVLDHVIIGHGAYTSLRERGSIRFGR